MKSPTIKPKMVIWTLVLWQLISVYQMSTGVWSQKLVWFNLILTGLFILLRKPYESLLLLIVSIPFYVAIPNPYFDSLTTWRPLFLWLFVVWLVRLLFKQREYLQSSFMKRYLKQQWFRLRYHEADLLITSAKRIGSRFFSWEKYGGLFLLIALFSVFVAKFPGHALKQIIFLINVYLVYLVLINVVTNRSQILEVIKYSVASLGIIVLLGYIQFILTFFSSPYYFWQYWAIMVSKIYYGSALSDVLSYSNSWFSYSGGAQSLRMFSIMPDSHSFAMIGVFLITFMLALIPWYYRRPKASENMMGVFKKKNYYIWNVIRFTGLAIIFSGTRGIWVGMLPVLCIAVFLYMKKISRLPMKRIIFSQLLIILFFALTPVINQGLNYIRVMSFEENFLDRAASIYDLEESSNAGRLVIWKDSLVYALHHPFGTGYGNFVVSLVDNVPEGASFAEVAEQKNLRYNLPQKFVSAHSLYLNILVEVGIAGLLAFLLFWLEYLLSVWGFMKKYAEHNNVFHMFVIASAFMFLWFLAYGMFDVTIFNDKVLMFTFISLGLSGLIMKKYEQLNPEVFEEESKKGAINA